jgi:hypothetical protein
MEAPGARARLCTAVTFDPSLVILLRETGDLGGDRLGDLLVHQALHVQRDAPEHQACADREYQQIGERELENGRAEELTERCHGSCILLL